MKDTFYFPHDYDPTTDLKIGAMLTEYGANGYGLYWRIAEILHSEETHKLPHKKYVFIALSKQMLTDVEQIETFVNSCINIYELFESDGDNFWSERVFRNIEIRNNIKESHSIAGKISAEKRKQAKLDAEFALQNSTVVEQQLTGVEQNPTKERKGKEIKGNEIKREFAHLQISISEYDKLVSIYGSEAVDLILDKIENYKDNKKYTSLYLTAKNWLKKDNVPKYSSDEISKEVDWDKFLQGFNRLTGKAFKEVTEAEKVAISKILKTSTKKDLQTAIENAKKHFVNFGSDAHLTIEFISRPEQFKKFSQPMVIKQKIEERL